MADWPIPFDKYHALYICINHIHPELGLAIAVPSREREQGNFGESTEGAKGRSGGASREHEGAQREHGGAQRCFWISVVLNSRPSALDSLSWNEIDDI